MILKGRKFLSANNLLTGDSAGGNLATAIDGELAKEQLKLTGAILIYPCVQVASTGLPSQESKVKSC